MISFYFTEYYILKSEEWKYDSIPEIMDGKNVADFIDPDIEARLDELEREEERLTSEGYYNDEADMVTFFLVEHYIFKKKRFIVIAYTYVMSEYEY